MVWEIVNELYEKKNAQNKTFLFRKLMYLQYTDGTLIFYHLNIFHGILNQLVTLDMKLDDEIHTLCLINSLLDCWEILIVSLSNSASDGVLTLKMVKESMLNNENRRKEQGINT